MKLTTEQLKPEKYSLYLTPFLRVDNFTFDGHVTISAQVLKHSSRKITIHCHKLQIFENTVRVLGSDKQNLLIEGFGYDDERQFFIIKLFLKLRKGENITISMDFLGDLNSDLIGFYRSSYFDNEKNQIEFLATTQFQV